MATSLTWIEVADNAVKIGIGGFIGFASAWFVARLNAQSAIDKILIERRLGVLLDASKAFEALFQGYSRYFTHLCGIESAISARPSVKMSDEQFRKNISDLRSQAVELRRRVWMDLIQDAYAAHSHLMLVRAPECRKHAEALYKAIGAADESFRLEDQPLESIDLTELKKLFPAIVAARESFYSTVADAFDKSGSRAKR